MPCSSGSCILTSVEDVENLTEIFSANFICTRNTALPFEMKGV